MNTCLLICSLLYTVGAANGGSQPQQQQQQVQASGGGAAAGTADYSKQWAEYYRSIGKNEEAEAIENQIKATIKVNHSVYIYNM